jgi:hypothetical protein
MTVLAPTRNGEKSILFTMKYSCIDLPFKDEDGLENLQIFGSTQGDTGVCRPLFTAW